MWRSDWNGEGWIDLLDLLLVGLERMSLFCSNTRQQSRQNLQRRKSILKSLLFVMSNSLFLLQKFTWNWRGFSQVTFICVLRAWLLGSRTQITVPDVRPHGSLFRNLFLDSAASVSQEATIIGLHFFIYIVIFFCLCGNDLKQLSPVKIHSTFYNLKTN